MEGLSELFLLRSQPPSRWPATFWVTIATISTVAAAFVALQPGRLGDLRLVREWLHYWTASGLNPYARFDSLDYPPIAFLVLWPLGLPSDATAAYWFLPFGIGMLVIAAWTLLGWMSERIGINLATSDRVALVAILVASGGARTSLWLGQTAALSLLFGALAVRWSRRRPYLAAFALALCGFKPHIAVGFGLAILLTTGIDVIVLAAALTLSLSFLFALMVGVSLRVLTLEYVANLFALYDGPNRVRGLLSLRFVLDDLIGVYHLSTLIYLLLAAGCLASLVVFSRRRRNDVVTQTQVAVGCILWTILFLPHQLYNSMLAAPALWLLMWPEGGLVRNRTTRAVTVAGYVLFGVFDIPRTLRLLTRWQPSFDWVFSMSYYLSPLRIVVIFALILWSLFRHTGAGSAARRDTTSQ